MEMGTGVAGRRAVLPAEMATRSGPGHVATPAPPPSPGLATCPVAQVRPRPSIGGY